MAEKSTWRSPSPVMNPGFPREMILPPGEGEEVVGEEVAGEEVVGEGAAQEEEEQVETTMITLKAPAMPLSAAEETHPISEEDHVADPELIQEMRGKEIMNQLLAELVLVEDEVMGDPENLKIEHPLQPLYLSPIFLLLSMTQHSLIFSRT